MIDAVPKKSDSNVRGVIFVNLFCVTENLVSIVWKILASEGVSNLDFAVFRALVSLFFISLYCWYMQTKPWVEIPRRHYVKVLLRSLIGTLSFIIYFTSI